MDSEKRLRNWAKFWEKEDSAVAFDLKAGADAITKVKRVHEVVRTLDRLDDEAWKRSKVVSLLNEALSGYINDAEPNQLTIGSLFTGYGGTDFAIQSVIPSTTAWFCEFDKNVSKVLEHHWPDIPNFGDVTKVDWTTVPYVDIIAGSTPCQDLSHAGKRAGMTEGTRSNLWVGMREAIEAIRPRLVVWENVQGALSAKADSESDMEPGEGLLGEGRRHLRALGRVLGDLAEMGYDARWTTIRASDVGAPHRRSRVFLVATTAHPGRERHGEGLQSDHLGRVDGADEGQAQKWEWARQVSQYRGPAHVIDGLRPGVDDDTRRPLSSWGEYGPAVQRWEEIVGVAPAPTEVGPNGEDRVSPEFTEWMMGIPAGHITSVPGLTYQQMTKIIGNGVVPQQGAAAIWSLLNLDVKEES